MTEPAGRGEADARSVQMEAAFAEERRRAAKMALPLIGVVLIIVTIWVTIENGFPAVLFFYPFLIAFAALTMAPYFLERAGRFAPWHQYLFPFLVIALFAAVTLSPNPLDDISLPTPFRLRFGNELYLFLMIAASLFTYSPRTVLWVGVVAAAVWSAATLWILFLPGSLGEIPGHVWEALSQEQRVQMLADPRRVYIGQWVRLVVVLFVTSLTMAAFVRRSRELVYRNAAVERARANLSRYFSPNLVDELAGSDEPLRTTRSQEVAVLFADLVGFTAMSANEEPHRVIELLRDFHARMERAVFVHGGTLDKYIGDGVMATFGTPRAGTEDAANAMRCVRSMLRAAGDWNMERTRRGETPMRIGIGLHYGPVVMGDIGGASRLEFAVVGDTVNVASRLERLTRELQAVAIVSDALVAAVRRETPAAEDLLTGFVSRPRQRIRGHEQGQDVWVLMSEERPFPPS
jgi:adenylate cyclase